MMINWHINGGDWLNTFINSSVLLALFVGSQSMAATASSDDNYSMWVEPNYVDTAYSALLKSSSVKKVPTEDDIHDHIPFGWWPYRVKAEVLDVYKGPLKVGDEIELLVYVSVLSQLHNELQKDAFLVSFCLSKNGVYYTSRDYLVQQAKPANTQRFAAVRENGTDYEGSGDCSGNYPSLNPDTHH
ncbi:hypothetical protein OS175_00110 [Marinicella sp. S1101]|nr:hypothetical protein [Marinicella marina]MDJ1139140.1 hypothetical protein [Marinicella marina]